MQIVKTNDPRLLRDMASNALINTDIEGFKHHKQMRGMVKQITFLVQTVETLEERLDTIQHQLEELRHNG